MGYPSDDIPKHSLIESHTLFWTVVFELLIMFVNSATTAGRPADTDTIIPLHFFDDTPLWRAFILYSMFVFDSVLDPEKLRHSLESLAQREGWRKLGARMRRNVRYQRINS